MPIVPMIDILTILLIFFIVHTQWKKPPGVKLQLDVDKKAEFGVIVGIWDALTSVGIDAGEVPARIEINKPGAR